MLVLVKKTITIRDLKKSVDILDTCVATLVDYVNNLEPKTKLVDLNRQILDVINSFVTVRVKLKEFDMSLTEVVKWVRPHRVDPKNKIDYSAPTRFR
jgi:hypothetical protein